MSTPRHARRKPTIWQRFVCDTAENLGIEETPIFHETKRSTPFPYDFDSSAVIDEAERYCKEAVR